MASTMLGPMNAYKDCCDNFFYQFFFSDYFPRRRFSVLNNEFRLRIVLTLIACIIYLLNAYKPMKDLLNDYNNVLSHKDSCTCRECRSQHQNHEKRIRNNRTTKMIKNEPIN